MTQFSVKDLAVKAKAASSSLALEKIGNINAALLTLADLLQKNYSQIIDANKADVQKAKDNAKDSAILDRLTLDKTRIDGIALSVRDIAAQEDPVGGVLSSVTRPNGIVIDQISVPIGMLGMIYEARPNVTIDASALALKSRNGILLRVGADALETSLVLHSLVQKAMEIHGINKDAIAIVPNANRDAVGDMLTSKYIDVMIPRGGISLIKRVQEQATMPVFSHLDGVCHIYIHSSADAKMARDIVVNSKMQRVGVCNAAETLLLDENFAYSEDIVDALLESGCEIVGDKAAQKLNSSIGLALEEDWRTEYLAPKISIAVVSGVKEAVSHINKYGSGHTDAIVAGDKNAAEEFLEGVDSGSVMHNVSTRFADGGEYGLGAEIGISTGKLHARGPVGAKQLTTYKYVVRGVGQVR